jgi:hypothetical protein
MGSPIVSDGDEVSPESGSDRVFVLANSTVALIETRSLPLSVLTSSLAKLNQNTTMMSQSFSSAFF